MNFSSFSSSHISIPLQVILAPWVSYQEHLMCIREVVFVHEQGVPPERERDTWDPLCTHVLAQTSPGLYVGCGRLLPDGHIGRMAVLKPFRGLSVGQAILCRLMQEAQRRGDTSVVLSAQVHALSFYEKMGFCVTGDVYEDVDIPHQDMLYTF